MTAVAEISIITPVWNGQPFIKECVESVLSQDFTNWEMLIGDNKSTDGTREYLDQLNDERIRVFKHDKNLGIYGNLNFLLSKARSPIVYFLCADDYFLPAGLRRAVDEWNSAPSDTGVICFNKETIKYSKLMRYSYNVLPRQIDPARARLAFFLFGCFPGNLSNMSVKTEAAAGGFSEKFTTAGDFEMWSRITREYGLILSETETVYVRQHENTASNYMTRNGEVYNQLLIIFEKLIDELSPSFNRKDLILYFHVNICAQHFRRAIKAALFGRFAYMKVMFKAKSSILWPGWLQLFSCFPLGFLENGRETISVRLAKNFVSHSNLESA